MTIRSKKAYVIGLLLSLSSLAFAQQAVLFTPAEQQQIFITTAGLFSNGNNFTIDFSDVDDSEYCFPLPVGNASLLQGYSLEIVTSKGDAVKAMFDGAVRMSRKSPQYGNIIIIRHDNGLETIYANNAQNLVKVGQRVKAGQTLAIVGGNKNKYSCLFGIMVNGGWINPTIIVDPNSHQLRSQVIRCTKKSNRVDIGATKTDLQRIVSLDPDDVKRDPFDKISNFKLNLCDIGQTHWAYPLPGSHVISPYGGRRNHSGVDIKTCPNDKILAAFDGVVTKSGPFSGYGNCIVIKHAFGFETLYSHQSKNLVKAGEKVKAGEVIGLTGRTGRATTEHLHFEIKFRGCRLNPGTIFNHAAKKLKEITLTLSKNGRVK